MYYYLFALIPIAFVVYLLTKFFFDLLLRGFAPFLPSRPWVVEQIMSELEIIVKQPKFLALSTGRSGFFYALEKKYPEATMVAVESDLFPYLVSKVQSWTRKTNIKIAHMPVHHINFKDYDIVYSHLYPDVMRGLGSKMKYECKPGTIIISTGFNFPSLTPKKIVPLPDRKGRLDWLSRNQNLFQSSRKKFKKEKKAFFYEI